MILIAYDGSDDAKAAIVEGAKLFPGEPATIATAWSHFVDTMARSGAVPGIVLDYDTIDTATRTNVADRAREGAELARTAGFTAVEATTLAVTTSLADAILIEAERVEAKAIVLGSRGHGSVKAFLLGSVSSAVLHHADRPVVVIPSPEVAADRAERLTGD